MDGANVGVARRTQLNRGFDCFADVGRRRLPGPVQWLFAGVDRGMMEACEAVTEALVLLYYRIILSEKRHEFAWSVTKCPRCVGNAMRSFSHLVSFFLAPRSVGCAPDEDGQPEHSLSGEEGGRGTLYPFAMR